MDDYILRIIAKGAGVRGLACLSTNLVAEVAQRHQTTPAVTVALGRALTGTALMGALLKVRQRVALKFEGNGPLHKLVVESDAYGKVRGYPAVPDASLPPPAHTLEQSRIQKLLGAGVLTVVKDLKLKELVTGIVPLATSEIDEDLEFYLNQSEQIPSAVQVGVRLDQAGGVAVAGGLLIQALADHQETAIHRLAERVQELPPLVTLLHNGQTPEEVLALLFEGIEYETLEKRPLRFHCGCSRARSEKALISLGRAELQKLYDEGEAVVDCHFCHERYLFDRDDLQLLLDEVP